jgi:predicted hydrolase (HD superfamily)
MKTRTEALTLLQEFTKSTSLIKHSLAVEASMRWYAKWFLERGSNPAEVDIEQWGVTGLLHDFDYELHPDPTPPDGHPFFGNRLLGELGYADEIREAIMGHAQYSGVPRTSLMAKTLFAVDELSGFVTASVLVRPDKSIFNLEPSSVMKRMKDKAFARGCDRNDIRLGAEELALPLESHVANIITALREIHEELFPQGAAPMLQAAPSA